jgi:predicted phosphodiesterase
MPIAALYDIHGNLPALEAVVEEIRAAGTNGIVVGGDVVPGPLAEECLKLLLGLRIPVHFIYGNGETAVLEQMAGREPLAVPEKHRPVIRWTADKLAEFQPLLAGWPKTIRLEGVLFCHGTPRDENEIFTRVTPEDRLLPVFEGVDASLVVCGHTHMQFDRTIGATRVVNAGSVGMPFGEPGADWLLLGPGVELRHTCYDLTVAAERIRRSDYPEAEEFVTRYLLHPPTEKAMLETFAKAG